MFMTRVMCGYVTNLTEKLVNLHVASAMRAVSESTAP